MQLELMSLLCCGVGYIENAFRQGICMNIFHSGSLFLGLSLETTDVYSP